MKSGGFTLVEIMIVVAIIALLAAIAIPNLFRARISAEEGTAAAALHTIATAEIQWRATNPTFTSLGQLGNTTPPYIDSTLANGTKQGYHFEAGPVAGFEGTQFFACARPTQDLIPKCRYYIDETGVMCKARSGWDCPTDAPPETRGRCNMIDPPGGWVEMGE